MIIPCHGKCLVSGNRPSPLNWTRAVTYALAASCWLGRCTLIYVTARLPLAFWWWDCQVSYTHPFREFLMVQYEVKTSITVLGHTSVMQRRHMRPCPIYGASSDPPCPLHVAFLFVRAFKNGQKAVSPSLCLCNMIGSDIDRTRMHAKLGSRYGRAPSCTYIVRFMGIMIFNIRPRMIEQGF